MARNLTTLSNRNCPTCRTSHRPACMWAGRRIACAECGHKGIVRQERRRWRVEWQHTSKER